jgi:integrase/recombinase XerD
MSAGERRRGPVPAVMTGPLKEHESALCVELARLGYAASSVRDSVSAMRWLSVWMQAHRLTVAQLSAGQVDKFLSGRRLRCTNPAVARRGVAPVMRFLRGRGLVPGPDLVGESAVEVLVGRYRVWLRGERGLAGESVRCYGNQAKKFLTCLPEPLMDSLAGLDAGVITAFVVAQAGEAGSVWSAKALVTAMRSLLRFLQVEGLIVGPLSAAVPAVAGWRGSTLPRALPSEQVAALLAAHDVTTAVGLRDRTVLLMLARLGLRGAEVAALGLGDIDWRAGLIVVRGKGSRVEQLPLPIEVGEALGAYLSTARPVCACPSVFVTARVPYRPLTGCSIRAIMARGCQRARLPRLGAHRLRHTLATDMLQAGSPLAEVGQVLRHRSALSTAIYAKVDHDRLRELSRPWPGGAR